MDLLQITHAQLTGLCGVILSVAGSYAIVWALQAITGVRVLRTAPPRVKKEKD